MNHLETALHRLAEPANAEPAPANLADRALTRARQRSQRRGVLAAVGAATVATMVALGVTTAADHQQRLAPAPASTSATLQPRMNVLLIGADSGPGRVGTRPDTIILASIDTRTRAITLFGLPRSLQRVPFPPGSPAAEAWPEGFSCSEAGAECLLNSVWHWAENDGARYYPDDRQAGLTATSQVVAQITGLTVDDTVVITMAGLTQLVDAVGGVEVNVTERLPIGGNATDQRATGGWIEKGRQQLNGEQATWFARSRWSTHDGDRMLRQRCLLTALAELVDLRKLLAAQAQITEALGDNLRTTLRPEDLASLAHLWTGAGTPEIRQFELGTEIGGGTVDPDFAAIRRFVRETLRPSTAAGTPEPGRTAQRSTPGC